MRAKSGAAERKAGLLGKPSDSLLGNPSPQGARLLVAEAVAVVAEGSRGK